MRIVILLSLLALSIPAYAQQTREQVSALIDNEFQGWSRVTELSHEQCLQSSDENPLPPSMALKKHDCWAKLVVEDVGVVAVKPEFLMKYLTDTKQVALDYKKGRIDRDEANLEREKLWVAYYTALVDHVRKEYECAMVEDAPI